MEHRTDSLSAAYVNATEKQRLTESYEKLCQHYNMRPTRNNLGISHENGAIEAPHGSLKRRIEQRLYEFIVFAEVMSVKLIQTGKTSELIQLLKHIEVSKGAVNYKGAITNPNKKSKTSSGGSAGGNSIPKTTIRQAIEQIEQTFQISKEDALVIREVCEEVSEKEEIKTTVLNNRKDSLFLENYEPTVHGEVTTSYIERELWDKIDSPIYNDKGGIFAIMSKAVIQNIVSI